MAELFAALQATPMAEWARTARWGYAVLNATHILGIALLVGAMVPLNLLRIAHGGSARQVETARILVPCAIAGLVLAFGTGGVMFAARAGEYAALPVFQIKMALVAIGAVTALVLAWRHGLAMEGSRAGAMRWHALVSLLLWVGVIYLGRMIAFSG